MPDRDALPSVLTLATSATIATTAVTAICGVIETGRAAAPVNAISHIVFGPRAARRDDASAKYTAVGAALNTGAMLSWAAVHQWLFRPDRRAAGPIGALARGAATSAIAYGVDYHVVPRRLTPGFEARLSGKSLLAIYGALAIALAVGERFTRR